MEFIMIQPLKLCPSILSADFSRLGEDVVRLERAGADMIHIDVMDGGFVPNITVGPPVIKSLRKLTALPFDVHLMIERPERHLAAFADAGADILTVHAESCTHLSRTLAGIRSLGMTPSVALNPHTPVEFVQWVLGDVGMLLVMTVNPGFGGQMFIGAMYDKIRAVRAMAESAGLPLDIEVDGGACAENIGRIVQAGANVIVAGSAVFRAADMGAELESYRVEARAASASGT